MFGKDAKGYYCNEHIILFDGTCRLHILTVVYIYNIYIFICITVERELTLSSNWEVCLADGCHCCCWCSWIAHFSAGRASRDWADYWDCCACTVPLLVHLLAHFFIFSFLWPSNLILKHQPVKSSSFPPQLFPTLKSCTFDKVPLGMLLAIFNSFWRQTMLRQCTYRGCSFKFATGLTIRIGIVQEIYERSIAVLLAKWSPFAKHL